VAVASCCAVIERFETDVGPQNGARVIARAWSDPDYPSRLLDNATNALDELGVLGQQTIYIVVSVLCCISTLGQVMLALSVIGFCGYANREVVYYLWRVTNAVCARAVWPIFNL